MDLRALRSLVSHYREALDICGGESLSGPLKDCAQLLNQMSDWLEAPTEPKPASTMDAEVIYIHEPGSETTEKAFHRLHFIQGVFFAKGIWTRAEIEEHNRSGRVVKA